MISHNHDFPRVSKTGIDHVWNKIFPKTGKKATINNNSPGITILIYIDSVNNLRGAIVRVRSLHLIVNACYGQKSHACYLKESLTGMTQIRTV